MTEAYTRRDYWLIALIITVGAALRFWGLDNVGFHGDEETMALAVQHLLNQGEPLMPSGMYYPRAPGQLYFMAWSAQAFGFSEWALRFPSAVAGVLMILMSFFLGRRLLPPKWNLVFVLMIALLPSMIVLSQTARMYVFYITAVICMAVAIFYWERKGSWYSLLPAILLYLVALQFHKLAVFSSLLFFFPLLKDLSLNRLIQSVSGFAAAVFTYWLASSWSKSKYGAVVADNISNSDGASTIALIQGTPVWLGVVCVLAAGACVSWAYVKGEYGNWRSLASLGALCTAMITALLVEYHLVAILLLVGSLLHIREARGWMLPLAVAAVIAILFSVQLVALVGQQGENLGLKDLVREVLGQVSIWPYLRFADIFIVSLIPALLIYGVGALNFFQGKRLSAFLWLLVVAVWCPLLLMGFFKWDVPFRYMSALVPFYLLSFIAGLAYVCEQYGFRLHMAIATLLVFFIFIDPAELASSVNIKYGKYPDHKGAAEYMKTVSLKPNDLVVAEDVLQQTYYLGQVDYWVLGLKKAKNYTREREGQLFDIYTATPVISNGRELHRLMRRKGRGDIYIIGSGENMDRRNKFLSDGIYEALQGYRQEVIYTGRDGKTHIWRFPGGTSYQLSLESMPR